MNMKRSPLQSGSQGPFRASQLRSGDPAVLESALRQAAIATTAEILATLRA